MGVAAERHRKGVEVLQSHTKAREEAEGSLMRVQKERMMDQEDLDRRAVLLD